MRPSLLLLPLVALSALLALLPASAQAPPAKRALLVGVKSYDHADLDDLHFTERDITDLNDLLKAKGYTTTVLTTTAGARSKDAVPTLANIRQALAKTLTGVTKRDTVLVALSGHGLQFEKSKESYFCPSDGNPKKPETLLPLTTLVAELNDSGIGVKLLLVDACRNDPTPGKSVGLTETPAKGVAALFSCSTGQRSFETDKAGGGHGIFFHFVLEGLRGKAGANAKGEVTWNRLAEYVQTNVEAGTRLWIGAEMPQVPHEVKNIEGLPPVLLTIGTASTEAPRAAATTTTTDDDKSFTNKFDMNFVRVPKGTLWMGKSGEKEVAIPHDFYIGVTEVTQRQWLAIVGGQNPSKFSRQGEYKKDVENVKDDELLLFPVENVSWDMVQKEFLAKLNAQGVEKLGNGWKYRLPTEEEWEYACKGAPTTRAQSAFDFYVGPNLSNDLGFKDANFDARNPAGKGAAGEYRARPTKVGLFPANRLGIHDMHGNVWEWCDSPHDGGPARVVRGGSWYVNGSYCTAADRFRNAPEIRFGDLGFRVAAVPVR